MLLEVGYLVQYVRTNIGLINEDVFQIDIQLLDVNMILARPFALGGMRKGGPKVGGVEV